MLKITKSLTYHFIYVFPFHYEYLRSLAALEDDAVRVYLGDRSGFDMGDL